MSQIIGGLIVYTLLLRYSALGYLKYEKFYSVCDEFIKCCPYFNENNQNIKTGKYFITRVAGMTLVDFLKEYAVIYSIGE